MKDFRLLERRAMELGIIPKDYESDLLFNKYKKCNEENNDKKIFSDTFIENMIKTAKELGSYMEALSLYMDRGLITYQDHPYLKKTLFVQYLREELEKTDPYRFKKIENKLFK